MLKPFVYIQNLNLSYRNKAVLKDLYWEVNVCQNWVLWGESGSGKTSLAKAIAGLIPSQGSIEINYDAQSKLPAEVLFVESWYQFKNLEGVANFYYQQRYTSLQANDTLTVHAELVAYGKEKGLHFDLVEPILEALGFATFASSQLIELSSGEHKKLQLVKALWLKPQLLIIDQPYTGLDKASRKNLNTLLDQITAEGVQLILICNDLEFPESIDSFAEIIDGQIASSFSREIGDLPPEIHKRKIPAFLKESPIYSSTDMVTMVDVNISYGEKQVLKNINWEVKAGEKWLLQGPNGSGKSTLLSLINGDHPQSYANELYLFGNRRGTGESIWDIKQHIGLISPEFHWYFDATSTVWKCIASGFYDTVGLFQQLPYSKRAQVDELIEYFGLTENKNELLTALPLGKQRLVLLARTIIKNPELLILDEPCQGLDQQQTRYFNQLVDELCSNGMTLIYVGHFESQLPTCIEKRILLEKGEVKVVETILESV
ncbi:ATP-binding cassette domain-containing protein [Pedobacter sp. ISL-68]|uniref:ATP-binding cassette domain-containing protein n=1 Tax=unclassified Pedobacter TaxID=2628915 RepID=UPI001BE8DB1D|nr:MULTISPECIES: ATP-binding cassette domain-containing protein [unclassified Pedobacter]MBT2563718.1 ATP-binding cassette domain-containing protein [Pedobacter sp. ISL-64]MBT2589610.1 ATP-binding cassette domain-containing protein [Pedobacter sp. ISL-68]